jgi:GNAT superfamily N-acetyltransferase
VTITYAREQNLSAEEYIQVIGSTYMGERRPVNNPARVSEMLAGSNLIVTARGRTDALVGLARGMTDGAWVCYLADVCVRDGWQRRGIGKGLLDYCTKLLGPRVGIVLMSYPEAADYYRKIGMGDAIGFFREREDRS